MRGVFGRVKMGWVYLLGIGLMVVFSGLAIKEEDIRIAKANREMPKQEVREENVAISETEQKSAVKDPANKSTKSKPKNKTKAARAITEDRPVSTPAQQYLSRYKQAADHREIVHRLLRHRQFKKIPFS